MSRVRHVSWEVEEGVYLLGGYDFNNINRGMNSSELVRYDGKVEEAFPLKYIFFSSCAINEGDSVVLTGGWVPGAEGDKRVSRYNRTGWVEDLPNLLTGNRYHACGTYTNSNNQKAKVFHCFYFDYNLLLFRSFWLLEELMDQTTLDSLPLKF